MKNSHNVPTPQPSHPGPRPLSLPCEKRRGRGIPKPPKKCHSRWACAGPAGLGWETPGAVSAHPVVGGAGQLTQLALEVQVNGEVQVALWGEGGHEGTGDRAGRDAELSR